MRNVALITGVTGQDGAENTEASTKYGIDDGVLVTDPDLTGTEAFLITQEVPSLREEKNRTVLRVLTIRHRGAKDVPQRIDHDDNDEDHKGMVDDVEHAVTG